MTATSLSGQNRLERMQRLSPISIPVSFENTSDDDSLTPLSSETEDVTSASARFVQFTEAEMAREKELTEDPTAKVISPYLIQCRTCRSTIKLSKKSRFDACHWRKHRFRCMKKHSQSFDTPKKLSNTKGRPETTKTVNDILGPRLLTPSVVQHVKLDSITVPSVEPEPKPKSLSAHLSIYPGSVPDPPWPMTTLPPQAAFEEYFLRSHGKSVQPSISAHWQDWSWDQLLIPCFMLDLEFSPHLYLANWDSDNSTGADPV